MTGDELIADDEIYSTEIGRRGASGETSHPQGAHRLAGIEPVES